MSSLPTGWVRSSACPEDRSPQLLLGGPQTEAGCLGHRLSKGFQPWSQAWMGPVLVKARVRVLCVQLHGGPMLAGQNLRVTDGLHCLGLGSPMAGDADHLVSVGEDSETTMGVGRMRGYCGPAEPPGYPPAHGDHVGLRGVCIQLRPILRPQPLASAYLVRGAGEGSGWVPHGTTCKHPFKQTGRLLSAPGATLGPASCPLPGLALSPWAPPVPPALLPHDWVDAAC